MATIDLSVNVGGFLKLAEPLWVASAHYSTSKQSVSAWKKEGIAPAAFTLKTSKLHIQAEEKKTVRYPTSPSLPRFGRSFYCDGPKQSEFLTYEVTADLLKHARAELPETAVGISVLSDATEDYAKLAALCTDAAFCELNLKYSFRSKAGAAESVIDGAKQRFEAVLAEVGKFTAAFAVKPIFVKLPREMAWLAGSTELASLLDALHAHGKAGLIVANSRRMNVAEFIADGAEWCLENGVMCGEHLLDETIHLVGALHTACDERAIPVIATGGMIDPEHVLTALRAGAAAVQLCTAFVYNNRGYYNTLKWNLQNRVEVQGLKSLSTYVERLRTAGIAAIYATPFIYLENFWHADAQRRLQTDVMSSGRMDVVVMSGKTLVKEWAEHLKTRFSAGKGARFLLPNPDGPMFAAVQRAWGLTTDVAVEEKRTRVREAADRLRELWTTTKADRVKNVKEDEGEMWSRHRLTELKTAFHDQCPFHSLYLFDDKAYVAPYPFVRPGEVDVPVYVFFAGSREYQRLSESFDTLYTFAQQTSRQPLPVQELNPAADAQ